MIKSQDLPAETTVRTHSLDVPIMLGQGAHPSVLSILKRSSGYINIFICLFYIFLHFMLVRVLGYPVTIGFLLAAPIIFLTTSWTGTVLPSLYFCIGLGVFAILQVMVLGIDEENYVEVLKTSLLIALNGCVWIHGSMGRLKIDARVLRPGLNAALYIVVGFLLLQQISYRVFGFAGLFGILGDFSYLGVMHPPETQGQVRAYALYLEPSYCALVLLSIYVALLLSRSETWYTTGIFGMGILCVGAFSGLIAGVFIVGIAVWLRRGLGYIHAFVFATLAMCIAIFGAWEIGQIDYVTQRFSELDLEGTSSYYRFVGPMEMVKDTLSKYPLGRGMGMVENVMSQYFVAHGAGYGTSVDNAIHLSILYFGWIGLLFWVGGVIGLLYALVVRNQMLSILLAYMLLAANFTGGGVFNIEFGVMLYVAILMYRSAMLSGGLGPWRKYP